MALAHSLLGELDNESKSTVRMLERVPMDKLTWTPHEKSMTLGRLAWHIATIPGRIPLFIDRGTFDIGQARPAEMPEQPDFVATYRENVAAARAAIERLDDEAIRGPFRMTKGETVIFEFPKAVMLRTILMNHSYHHRGQLSVYLRLLDVPVPAMYGTSADEQIR